ncbi:MAG: MBL fold metallo-hydrolase [Acidimicrobiia bacterium]|nr:MBL fold metallo-hydrolase [Acidimicrobiia bacterium]
MTPMPVRKAGSVPPVIADWGTDQRRLSDSVSVLVGVEEGKYPSANSLVVEGAGETVIIDPSVKVVDLGGAPVPVDAVINSHGHEDHIAGNGLFADARIHVHDADLEAVRTLDGLMAVYGYEGEAGAEFERMVIDEFHFEPRPDAQGFGDGHIFDLGGVTVEAVHLPGHTRGHSGFRIDGVFFLSDIDLTGFGPYYGDMWSDLDDFEDSLARVRDEEADYYVTSHHKGVIEGRTQFLEMLDAYTAVIARRDTEMLEFLSEPRTLDDMVAHRFIYRPDVDMPIVSPVEHRSADLHVRRMLRRGQAVAVVPGRFQRT